MIGTVLKELETSVKAQLSNCIDKVQAMRAFELGGETLVNSFTFYDWFDVQTGRVKVGFPALTLAWAGTVTGQRNGTKQRKGKHRIIATYGVRHNDAQYLRRHMLYVPEAILLWLDELPTASRPPHSGLTITGLDRANEEEITIAHDVERNEGGFFIWSVDVPFTVTAIDENLPARSTLPTS